MTTSIVDRRVKTYQSDLSLKKKTWAFWASSLTFSTSIEETIEDRLPSSGHEKNINWGAMKYIGHNYEDIGEWEYFSQQAIFKAFHPYASFLPYFGIEALCLSEWRVFYPKIIRETYTW